MSEIFEIDEIGKSDLKFPSRKVPEVSDKFPFRDLKYYTNPEDQDVKTVSVNKTPKMGYVAQLSINHLESTGRNINLQNVPWFRTSRNNGKR